MRTNLIMDMDSDMDNYQHIADKYNVSYRQIIDVTESMYDDEYDFPDTDDIYQDRFSYKDL